MNFRVTQIEVPFFLSLRNVISSSLMVIVFSILPMQTAISEHLPINLCEYSGPSFHEVNAMLHERVRRGDPVEKLIEQFLPSENFQVTEQPHYLPELHFSGSLEERSLTVLNPPFLETKLLIRAGTIICEDASGNVDMWGILANQTDTGELISFDLELHYDASKSAEALIDRNEALNAYRFIGDNGFHTRVLKLFAKQRNLSASELFREMEHAGYWDGNLTIPNMSAIEAAKPHLIKGYMLPLGLRPDARSKSTLFFRSGMALMNNLAWPIAAITYDPETDEIIKIEPVRSF